MRQGWTVVVIALVAAACGAPPRPISPAPVPADGARLSVTLGWSDAVDLDLYVTEPGLETAYYANPRTRSGGVFELDARCTDGAGGTRYERARWTSPPPGRYRVGVDFPESCAGRNPQARYTVFVDLDGERHEVPGTVRLLERKPQLLDVVVPEQKEAR